MSLPTGVVPGAGALVVDVSAVAPLGPDDRAQTPAANISTTLANAVRVATLKNFPDLFPMSAANVQTFRPTYTYAALLNSFDAGNW